MNKYFKKNNIFFYLFFFFFLFIFHLKFFSKFLPLLVILTYFIAPIPNFIAKKLSGNKGGEYDDEESVR